jgi:hypothetical protein
VPERMCNTPVDERGLASSQSNYAGSQRSRNPERERSSNRERSHDQGNSSATERNGRGSRRNTGEVSYLSLENGSRETLPPPYATFPPPGENRIPIILRRHDTNPPPYATTAPSGSENRIPIVLRRPNSSPLLPNADPLSPWQRNPTPPMARQYTLPVRPRSRPDSRNHNIRAPEFIPYENQRGNPNFEPARLHQFGMRHNLDYPVNRYQNTFSHHYAFSHPKECVRGVLEGHRFQRCLQCLQCLQCVECVQCRQYSRCGIDIDSHQHPQTGHPGPVARVRKAEMTGSARFNEGLA